MDLNGRNHKTGKGKFAYRLASALRGLGVDVVMSGAVCDIALHIGRVNYKTGAKADIIRLGPAHVDENQNYEMLNKQKWLDIKTCDGIIYQSGYSQYVCEKYIGNHKCPKTIIFNGYTPIPADNTPRQPVFLASTRKWIPQKRLKNIIEAFDSLDIKDKRLIVCGFTGYRNNTKSNIKSRGVEYWGDCDEGKLAIAYSAACALISIVYLDACPNSVVEAICSGIPVICTDQGGTRELVEASRSGVVIADKPWNRKPIDLNHPPKADVGAICTAMKTAATGGFPVPDSTPFDITRIAEQYIEFFEDVLIHG